MGYGMPTPATAGATAAAATAAAAAAGGSGELLEYLRGLPSDSLCELTAGASPEVRVGVYQGCTSRSDSDKQGA
jgi:hypothetical protein